MDPFLLRNTFYTTQTVYLNLYFMRLNVIAFSTLRKEFDGVKLCFLLCYKESIFLLIQYLITDLL